MTEGKGCFVSFEGIDGCGKSTQLGLTADWLRSLGEHVVTTFEPGDTPLGREIRKLLLTGEHVPVPEAELFLFLADRAQHVHGVISPALAQGAWVLCDRYSDSTLAYQLAGRKLQEKSVERGMLQDMLLLAELGVHPDLTFWLDVPVTEALARMQQRSQKGEPSTRLDEEALPFHEKVHEAFRDRWQQEKQRIHRIDVSGSREVSQQAIRQACMSICPRLSSI